MKNKILAVSSSKTEIKRPERLRKKILTEREVEAV